MQQLFIINPTAGKTDASVVLVPSMVWKAMPGCRWRNRAIRWASCRE